MVSSHVPDPPDLSEHELALRIVSESDTWPPEIHKLWRLYKCSSFKAVTNEGEPVFVVATSGSLVLFFDNSEDEFAIGHLCPERRIIDAGLYGNLMDALRGLLARQKTAVVPGS